MPHLRRLVFTELFLEVFNEHLQNAAARRHRLLVDEGEALSQRLVDFIRQKDSRFKGLFDFAFLDDRDKLLEELAGPLRALRQIAKQQGEEFFWVTDFHVFLSLFVSAT